LAQFAPADAAQGELFGADYAQPDAAEGEPVKNGRPRAARP
jgi:hypothetical protein